MEIDPTSWAWSKIAEKVLTPAQGIVLLAIARRASVEHEGICWPGATDIHVRCGLDVRYVRRTIRKLEKEHKLFKIIPCTWSSGTTTSNLYVLNLPRDKAASDILKNIRRARGDVRFNETLFLPGGVSLHFGEGPGTRVGNPAPGQGRSNHPGPGTRVGGSPDPGLQTRVGGSIDHGVGGSIDPPIRRINLEGKGNTSIQDGSLVSSPADDAGFPSIPEYSKLVLGIMGELPGTRIQSLDRNVVRELHRRSIPLSLIESACWLAVGRAKAAPGTFTEIRSFRYFKPAIEEFVQAKDKAIFRQAAYVRLKLLGDAATEEDHQAFERMYGGNL